MPEQDGSLDGGRPGSSHGTDARTDRRSVRVLLDVSPVGSRPETRTGLARVALSLGLALASRPDVSLAACSCGSVDASRQFRDVRRAYPELGGLDIEPGPFERLYLAATHGRQWLPPRLGTVATRRFGQVVNRCRNPLRGHDIRRFDVFHSTYASIPRIVRRARLPVVITVHDLTPLKVASALMPPHQIGVTRRILHSIQPDDWVVCVSEHTRRDFLEYSSHRDDRTVTIPNGIDHRAFLPVHDAEALRRVRGMFDIGMKPFVLTLSSLAPHKNLATLAAAWPAVRRRCGDGILVIAGGAAAQRDELAALFTKHGEPESIRFTGFVGDDVYRALASACQAFLFPSIYEGFGLPVLEAMACGAPVICANTASLPEVAGQAGRLLPPLDDRAWSAAIAEALAGPVREGADERSLEQARRFSWDACAEQLVRVYSAACRE
jgi:glycosyltransferase involved in cell wall biosynthesis